MGIMKFGDTVGGRQVEVLVEVVLVVVVLVVVVLVVLVVVLVGGGGQELTAGNALQQFIGHGYLTVHHQARWQQRGQREQAIAPRHRNQLDLVVVVVVLR